MDLLLEIISHQRHTMTEQQTQFVFKAAGGTIGRGRNSDWLIDDPERLISGQHAAIHFDHNQFVISDTSTNGLFVNNQLQPLGETPHIVCNGDIFLLGQYSLQATLIATQSRAVFSSSLAPAEPAFQSSIPLYNEAVNELMPHSPHSVDPLSQFDNEPAAGSLHQQDILAQPDPINSILDPVASTQSYFDLPNAIPENWLKPAQNEKHTITHDTQSHSAAISDSVSEPLSESLSESLSGSIVPVAADSISENSGESLSDDEPLNVGSFEDFQKDFSQTAANEASIQQENVSTAAVPSPATVRKPTAVNTPSADRADYTDAELIKLLFNKLGVNPDDINARQLPHLIETIGQISRQSLEGIMQTMMSRAHLKSEFRLAVTTIQKQENNPLKFCINYEQLLHYMLLNPVSAQDDACLSAEQAVQQAFQEIQEHQIGVMAGMKSALQAMLQKLSPEKVMQQAERYKSGTLALGSKKSRYWDTYSHLYADINDEDETFTSAFGNEFCKAYERQIEAIRQAGNKS